MDEKLSDYRANLQRAHDRLFTADAAYEQGEAEGLSFALDVFDSYFGEVN